MAAAHDGIWAACLKARLVLEVGGGLWLGLGGEGGLGLGSGNEVGLGGGVLQSAPLQPPVQLQE